MAKGSPDFYVKSQADFYAQSLGDIDININAQSIGQITNRGTYGEAQRATIAELLTSGETDDLFTINGTGLFYGCFFYIGSAYDLKSNHFTFSIDGNTIVGKTLEAMLLLNLKNSLIYPARLLQYKLKNSIYNYAMEINGPLTFESQVKCIWTNTDTHNITVYGDCVYATI